MVAYVSVSLLQVRVNVVPAVSESELVEVTVETYSVLSTSHSVADSTLLLMCFSYSGAS